LEHPGKGITAVLRLLSWLDVVAVVVALLELVVMVRLMQ
jgi:hypothetical protein